MKKDIKQDAYEGKHEAKQLKFRRINNRNKVIKGTIRSRIIYYEQGFEHKKINKYTIELIFIKIITFMIVTCLVIMWIVSIIVIYKFLAANIFVYF